MALTWVRDEHPRWDADKQRVIGQAPPGVFTFHYVEGSALPGDWWSVLDDQGVVVGYGWLDSMWGDAEILLAVDPSMQNRGVGSFILSQLEQEAGRRGMNYVYNVVRPTHPERERLHDWLSIRGYRGSEANAELRKRVDFDPDIGANAVAETRPGTAGASRTGRDGAPGAPSVPEPPQEEPTGAVAVRVPGTEESGGYVDVKDHRY